MNIHKINNKYMQMQIPENNIMFTFPGDKGFLLPLVRHRGTDICITFIWKISSVNYLLGEVRV